MAASAEPILIVDDDELVARAYDAMLEVAGWTDRTIVTDSRDVLPLVATRDFAVILLDLNMPHVGGRELLEQLTVERPDIPVIILTLEDKIDVAVECMRVGAFDFMTKPVDENRLVNSVAHAVRVYALHNEVRVLSSRTRAAEIEHPEHFASIVTASESMQKLFAYVETIAASPRSVLITGESGTGKELLARAIHDASGRRGRFVPVNVAGLDDTVFSDTLFGHRRGAYTGADSNRRGLVEQASGGTLFLDEIGDLDNAAQVKLLRLLQEDEYYALGADEPQTSTARIVAATNADLAERQADGRFRRDLYYRLMGHHLDIPPLRDRREDIPVLVARFFAESYETMDMPPQPAPAGAADLFRGYEFPGNVRELQSIVFDVVSRSGGRAVEIGDLAAHPVLAAGSPTAERTGGRLQWTGSLPTLGEVEDFLFQEALDQCDGNQSAAARLIGVSQSTLSRWLARGQKGQS
jgi:DNA-binding NtrC family response regulator